MMETGIIIRKSAIDARRELLGVPAVMSVLEPVEKAVFLASTSRPIADYEIAEVGIELRKMLKWIAKDVGIRATDDEQYMIVRTAEILKRYYGNLSFKDFKMAFEMVVTGELDDYLPKDRSGQADRGHFQQFNAEYVCKVLNAYKARRERILRKVNGAIPEAEERPTMEDLTTWHRHSIQQAVDAFTAYRENGYLGNYSPITEICIYKVLEDAGLAVPVEITAEEQRAAYFRTMQELLREGRVAGTAKLREKGIEADEVQGRAYGIARRVAIGRTFDECIAKGIDVEAVLKGPIE